MLQDLSDLDLVLGLGFGEDQNVIKVHKHKPLDDIP